MAITAQDVNKLRQMTGAGMMDCKKALTESDGDFEKAIEILRKKGQKVSASRSDRETTEGSVFVRTNDSNTKAVLISLTCETDFVAKNEEFVKLGNTIIDLAFAKSPASVEDLKALKAGDLTVDEKIIELVGKIGEKLEISAYEVMEAETVVSYIHAGSKLGVLVALKGGNSADVIDAGRDVGMQIAAMNPIAVDQNSVDKAVIEKEIEIGKDIARQEGKPDEMVEKIALGKLNKFFKESTLLSQAFVKDNSKTIAQYLDSVQKGLTVTSFKRISIG
ncbi:MULTISPECIES: translation elongation factor Ts [unclassified Imperialibacter]|uniref:translation elongation factor Ts n=1 Tax=unclassified Imperialibacter TaxID=2629706 RepID=UPI00125419EF|nr:MULTISPECIES: translation elongation factor Ts [unclassified Imperialibacter]CAD5247860.1 Elongation factor Ts [Imperialibacter sp. 75]CAD5247968.1 Elongation factor Ts [Imperialibacter sp. 89]VVS97238.1 Elongation factor Ts [Imperialibacter sp. EC-SDR9]